MRKAGRSAGYVFGVWIGIAVACGLSSLVGYAAFGQMSPFMVAVTTALATGAMLTMIVDMIIPEKVEEMEEKAEQLEAEAKTMLEEGK
jgi:ZIP family zinc transporter